MRNSVAKSMRKQITRTVRSQGKPTFFARKFYKMAKKLYNTTPRNKRYMWHPIDELNKWDNERKKL